jgi:ThiF family
MKGATLRFSRSLIDRIRDDLARPHPIAYERIGFVTCRLGRGRDGELLVLARDYLPVDDAHYLLDKSVGAKINSAAIRAAMQHALDTGDGLFHVHGHGGRGIPSLSPTDRSELPRLVQSLRVVGDAAPHGALLLSGDQCTAWIWLPGACDPIVPERITVVGYPLQFVFPKLPRVDEVAERFSRQSFLGEGSQTALARARFGIVGLGGGGSHIVQQLAHLGALHFRLFDNDVVENSNLNRLVGATAADAAEGRSKVAVMERVISALSTSANARSYEMRWQDDPEALRTCDVVFGCVDSFAQRRELEVACRRYLIPYIDIGMDVHQVGDAVPRIAGQVVLSMPGQPCMFCLGFLNDQRLAMEASQYGAAGSRPQVVWANGVLASSAVGVAVDLLSGWSGARTRLVYLSYDGNAGTLAPHVRMEYPSWPAICPHYPLDDVGDP